MPKRELMRVLAGAALSVLVTALVCRTVAAQSGYASWIVASMAASAVLMLTTPSSPFAQPWPVVGGNTLSALVGALCAQAISDSALAGACAVALSMAIMFMLRCLHPPGAAAALLAATTGVHWSFAIFPILCNCIVLVATTTAFNSVTGQRSHSAASIGQARRQTRRAPDTSSEPAARVLPSSDGAALSHEGVTSLALWYPGHIAALRCEDAMQRDPMAVRSGDSLHRSWAVMRTERINALPVLDESQRIIGIVTTADFLRQREIDRDADSAQTLGRLDSPAGLSSRKPSKSIGEIMTHGVRVAHAQSPLVDLVAVFSEGRFRHLPVIDDQRKLVGMISQSDLLTALHQAASQKP